MSTAEFDVVCEGRVFATLVFEAPPTLVRGPRKDPVVHDEVDAEFPSAPVKTKRKRSRKADADVVEIE